MKITDWFRNLLPGNYKTTDIPKLEMLTTETCVRELALQAAINLLAGAFVKCEFRCLKNGVPTMNDQYYVWNVRPNCNQSSSAFRKKLIEKLCRDNEALIVMPNDKGEHAGEIFVADSYRVQEFALKEYLFSDIVIDDYTLTDTFGSSDVLYVKLHNSNINTVVSQLYNVYGKLLSAGMKGYERRQGVRAKLSIDARAMKAPDFEETYKKMTGTDLKAFIQNPNAVLPEYDGYTYSEIGGEGKYASDTTRDLKALVDDIFEFTAKAFCIPAAVLRGETADTSVAVDNFLTFSLDPLCKCIQDEINAKQYKRASVLKGNRVEICTHMIRHYDLLGAATGVEKLISSGVFSVNGVLKILGEPALDEPWADEHYITKNYEKLKEEGGEKNE